jgi:hypothetical protein
MGYAARVVLAAATVAACGYALTVLSSGRSDSARAMPSGAMAVNYAQRGAVLDPVLPACVLQPGADIEGFIAQSGTTCPVVQLSDGAYRVAVKNSIEIDRPVILQGQSRDGVIVLPAGMDNSARPLINITSNAVVLKNFTVAGMPASEDIPASYDSNRGDHLRQRLIGVQYTVDGEVADPVSEVRLEFMTVRFAGRECIRIKNSARNVLVTDNAIDHCGGDVFDWSGHWRYELDASGASKSANGEGIYIGSDYGKQTRAPDAPSDIRIERNAISTFGAECVDVKEGATRVSIQHNICANSGYGIETGKRQSGLISIQGNANAAIGNALCAAHDGPGAKTAQLAGYGIHISNEGGYGLDNIIRQNLISGPTQSFFRVNQGPQRQMCGNFAFGSAPMTNSRFAQDAGQPCPGQPNTPLFADISGASTDTAVVLAAICAGRVVPGLTQANGFDVLGLIETDGSRIAAIPARAEASATALPMIPLELPTTATSPTALPATEPALKTTPTLTKDFESIESIEDIEVIEGMDVEPTPEASLEASPVPRAAGDIDIEAENATLTDPLIVGNDARASGGRFVWTARTKTPECTKPGVTSGWAEVSLTVAAGDYALWLRSNAGGAPRDTYCVRIDDAEPFVLNLRGGTGWRWRKQNALVITLTEGAHTLRIRPLRPGSKLDRLFLSVDADATPR